MTPTLIFLFGTSSSSWIAQIPLRTLRLSCPTHAEFLEPDNVISVKFSIAEFPPSPVGSEAETWEVPPNQAIGFCCSSHVTVFSY